MENQENKQNIYTEEKIIILAPLKARIFKEEYQKIEAYTECGTKVIILKYREICPAENIKEPSNIKIK